MAVETSFPKGALLMLLKVNYLAVGKGESCTIFIEEDIFLHVC